MLKNFFIISAFLGVFSTLCFADAPSINPRPRSMSMGFAGLALTGSRDSASLNPAGLADITESSFDTLNVLAEAPFELDFLTDTLDLKDDLDNDSFNTKQKRAALQEYLSAHSRRAASARLNVYPAYTRKNYHVGILADALIDPRLRIAGATGDQLASFGQSSGTVGVILAAGFNTVRGVQVGLTVKPLYRFSFSKNERIKTYDILRGLEPSGSVSDEIFGEDFGGYQSFGLGADLGFKYRLPWANFFKPSVGVTYQDIGRTRFFSTDRMPTDIEQSISVGFAIEPEFQTVKWALAIDARNIQDQKNWLTKLHMGLEAKFLNWISARVGLSQGYYTLGVGMKLSFFEFDTFLTAREVGRYARIQETRTFGSRFNFTF